MSGPFGSSQWMYKSEEYVIANSCKFSAANADYLKRTPSGASNRRTWTWSSWLKRSRNNATHMVFFTAIADDVTEDDHFGIRFDSGTNNFIITWGDGNVAVSTRTFRDSSNWFHLVVAIDTTQGTDTNRIKAYVNGEILTFGSTDLPGENHQYGINKAQEHNIGSRNIYGSASHNNFDGYMAEINFVDGSQLTPSSFGETGAYGEWKPKEYAGAHGTNGFYLPFDDSSDLGDDESSNTNDWTEVNIAAINQVPDTPSNNFCTWQEEAGFGVRTLTEGGLRYNPSGGTGDLFGSIGVSTGKWYFETCRVTVGASYHTGVASDRWNRLGYNPVSAGGYSLYAGTYFYSGEDTNNPLTLGNFGAGSNGDIIGCAFDLDNDKIWFAKNNTYYNSGDPAAGNNATGVMNGQLNTHIRPFTSHGNSSYAGVNHQNYGQDSSFGGEKTAQGNADSNGIGDFFYAPPSGFLALCTSNLPAGEFTSVTPSKHFKNVLWDGDGNDDRSIAVGFQPDFAWIKSRSTANDHLLFDAARGVDLYVRANAVDGDTDNDNTLQAFESNGIQIGSDTRLNTDADDIVGYFWKGGGGSGSSNTDGSIDTTTTSANVAGGFSISTYTGNATSGATLGHGLSKAPTWMMVKKRVSGGWMVYHQYNTTEPETEELNLEVTEATQDSDNIWNDTAPTATVMSLGNNAAVNANNVAYVLYCWHDVEGYSKFGAYTGNGQNVPNGVFTYLGFRPAWLMIKRTDSADPWVLFDAAREPNNDDNAQDLSFKVDTEAVEAAYGNIDFTSNGFKAQITTGSLNEANSNFIYMAFADVPVKFSNAR